MKKYKQWFMNSLWNMGGKIEKIEIKSSPRGEKGIDTSKLDKFKEQVIVAIRKRKKEVEDENVQKKETLINKVRATAIQDIEGTLTKKEIKIEELNEKFRNYQEQINNLNKRWEIQSLAEDVISNICKLGRERNKNRNNFKSKNSDKNSDIVITEAEEVKKLNQEKGSLKNQNNQEKLTKETNNLKQSVQQLEKEVEELRNEIQELKIQNINLI